MSEIKAGDLVMVVRPTPCCDAWEYVGRCGTVKAIFDTCGRWCSKCGHEYGDVLAADVSGLGEGLASRLIKIDPPPIAQDVPAVEELTA